MRHCQIVFPLFAFAATAVADTLVTTREGLASIADDLAGSYALGADIDLAGADWTPLGDEEMRRKESFTTFDFDDVWKIGEETYPYLRSCSSAGASTSGAGVNDRRLGIYPARAAGRKLFSACGTGGDMG